MKTRYLCGKDELETAQKAAVVSKRQAPGTKKIYYLDDKVCVVRCGEDYKDILIIPGTTPALWCVPVRRPELRRGIVAVAPTPPAPAAFSADARALVKNFEPLTAARKAGYTLAPRFSTDQNEDVTRLAPAYDSMLHPGDTSWHSADGKTVLSWWSGGRYATSSQVWFGVEGEDWAHPVTWDDVNASADPAAALTPALDGTLPHAYDKGYGYAGAAYAGERTVPPQALYGVWKNGKLLSKTLPGIAHCEREFMVENKKVLHHWSVFAYPHTQNGGVALTLTLRQKTGGVEVQLDLPDGMTTTLGEEHYSGFLVGEEMPVQTPYPCYAIFSPDATKLLIYGVIDGYGTTRTGAAYTLTLPTTPLTVGMDPLRLTQEVKGMSLCATVTTVTGSSVVPTTQQNTLESNVDTTPVAHNNAFPDGSSGSYGGVFHKSLVYATVTIENRGSISTSINRPTTRTSRERVDTVLLPTVDWSQTGELRYIFVENTYTNEKEFGMAQWTESGSRKAGSIRVPFLTGGSPAHPDWTSGFSMSGTLATEAAAKAHVAGNNYTVNRTQYNYNPSLRRYDYTQTSTNMGLGQGLVYPSGSTAAADKIGDTDHLFWVGYAPGTWFGATVWTTNTVSYNGGPQIYAMLHYLATSPANDMGYSLLVNGTVTIPVWNIITNVSVTGLNYTCTGPITSANRTFLKETNTKHAEASLAFKLDHCDFGVLNPPTTPYYVADQQASVDMVTDSTSGVTTDNSPDSTFNITCTPVNSVVAVGDTRWPVSVLATVKPLMVVGEWRNYYVGEIATGVRTEITFDEDDGPTKLNGATDAALDLMPAKYSYTTPTGKYFDDYNSMRWSVETLASIPPIGGADWDDWDAAAPPCHGLEHWFKYDISPGPRADQIMFGLSYENLSHPPLWGKRPAVWTREKKYAAAVQGAYGDEVFYNSPIFTAIYKPEKL